MVPEDFFTRDLTSAFTPEDLNGALGGALAFIYDIREDLSQFVDRPKDMESEKVIIDALLRYEIQAKKEGRDWRFVVDFSTDAKGKYMAPVLQFCSGPPHYNRYVMEFTKNPDPTVNSRVEVSCVETTPDLTKIAGGATEEQRSKRITLAQVKEYYDAVKMQRIAILGAARVFPYESNPDGSKREWAIRYNKLAQKELDKFLTYMDHSELGTVYATVNGGWAGMQEGSMGIPMVSHLFGAVHSGEEQGCYNPITVMPAHGSYDRVTTMADYIKEIGPWESFSSLEKEKFATAVATYFEIPGTWGDDSKYLVGVSTSLLVFDPHGAWTDIEITNGVAQNKPVAIIADPEKLAKGKYGGIWSADSDFWEQEPGVRVYKNAEEAAKWLNYRWQLALYNAPIPGTQQPGEQRHYERAYEESLGPSLVPVKEPKEPPQRRHFSTNTAPQKWMVKPSSAPTSKEIGRPSAEDVAGTSSHHSLRPGEF